MKILVLASEIGIQAPGIVFERIIIELSKFHQLSIFCYDYNVNNPVLANNINIEKIDRYKIPEFRQSQFINLLNFNPIDTIWSYKVLFKILKNKLKFDLILCLISNEHYNGIVAANVMYKFGICKNIAVYTVDAIPAPIGWSKNNLTYKCCKKFIKKKLSKINYIFAPNEFMLNYQLSIINKINIKSKVIYTPSPIQRKIYNYKHTNFIFLYTGEIYGARKVTNLFKALSFIIKEFPFVELHFVGSTIQEKEFSSLSIEEKQHIKIFPRSTDLTYYYENSNCLLDIDADLNNDVYLSSKIVNYLVINRPILCITGQNSPSRNIFKNIHSIRHCSHNDIEIYQCMKYFLENQTFNYSDRDSVLQHFEVSKIVSIFNSTIKG